MTTTPPATSPAPLVTAVINNYNYGRYLHSAIGSVLRQTYKPIQAIVVDDGSTDHSREVIQSFGDAVQGIYTENDGQAGAVNASLSAIRGDYVAFLDADDFWVPNKIETMMALAANNREAGLLYHRYLDTDLTGDAMAAPAPATLISGDYSRNYLRSGGSYWHPVMSTLMLKRSLLEKIVPIPTYPNREGADSVLTDCSILMSTVASHPDVMTYRRLHGTNFYAAGRETDTRTKDVRQNDLRRTEWRIISVNQVMRRHGIESNIDLRLNEWYQINRYMLGQVHWLQMARSLMANREHDLKSRMRRIKWFTKLKKSGST